MNEEGGGKRREKGKVFLVSFLTTRTQVAWHWLSTKGRYNKFDRCQIFLPFGSLRVCSQQQQTFCGRRSFSAFVRCFFGKESKRHKASEASKRRPKKQLYLDRKHANNQPTEGCFMPSTTNRTEATRMQSRIEKENGVCFASLCSA